MMGCGTLLLTLCVFGACAASASAGRSLTAGVSWTYVSAPASPTRMSHTRTAARMIGDATCRARRTRCGVCALAPPACRSLLKACNLSATPPRPDLVRISSGPARSTLKSARRASCTSPGYKRPRRPRWSPRRRLPARASSPARIGCAMASVRTSLCGSTTWLAQGQKTFVCRASPRSPSWAAKCGG